MGQNSKDSCQNGQFPVTEFVRADATPAASKPGGAWPVHQQPDRARDHGVLHGHGLRLVAGGIAPPGAGHGAWGCQWECAPNAEPQPHPPPCRPAGVAARVHLGAQLRYGEHPPTPDALLPGERPQAKHASCELPGNAGKSWEGAQRGDESCLILIVVGQQRSVR